MRKHSVRKWLHAILDLLPLAIIPIFFMYARNESATYAQTIEVEQNEVVDFNQYANYPQDSNRYVSYINVNSKEVIDNDTLKITTNAGTTNPQVTFNHLPKGLYYYHFTWQDLGGDSPFLLRCFKESDSSSIFYRQLTNSYYENRESFNVEFKLNFTFNINPGYASQSNQFLIKLNIFNLTQMFGAGNEPTIEQFKTWYPNDYYEYTTGRKELLKNVSTVTYSNTDIGSQMIYALYQPVHDYFNFNNVGVFQNMYDWVTLNMFGGNTPVSAFIVWNIVLYEFIMDILFLFYAVFMFIVDFAESMIDRAFYKAHKGCD